MWVTSLCYVLWIIGSVYLKGIFEREKTEIQSKTNTFKTSKHSYIPTETLSLAYHWNHSSATQNHKLTSQSLLPCHISLLNPSHYQAEVKELKKKDNNSSVLARTSNIWSLATSHYVSLSVELNDNSPCSLPFVHILLLLLDTPQCLLHWGFSPNCWGSTTIIAQTEVD